MKRSEMLNEIYRLLHCQPDYPTEDEILLKIEELGMLPPLRAEKVSLIDGTYMGERFNFIWESEDEI